jgi:diacylglycerol kinase (ATP)
MVKRKTVFAIINPATGQQSRRWLLRQFRHTALDLDIDFDFALTECAGHATELARECSEREVDIVVAVGGDGTVSEVVTGVIGTETLVGIIPAGSTNVIAKDLGIPRRLGPAIKVAMGEGKPSAFDVGKIDDQIFLHMAGAGYDAHIMHEANTRLKRMVGWPAYLPPAIKHLRSKPFEVEIDIDGTQFTSNARMVLLAIGGSIIHPRFAIGRDIDRTDGLLDVCIYNPPNAITAVTAMLWILLRKPNRSRWQRQFRAKKVVLKSSEAVPFEADGNPMGELPATIEMLEERVTILVPNKR